MSQLELTIIVVVVLIIGGVFASIWIIGGPQRKAKKLIATGIPVQAKIIQLLNSGMTTKGTTGIFFWVLFEITPPTGAPFQVKRTVRASAVSAPTLQPGNLIQVFIDPNNPKEIAIPGTDDYTPRMTFI